MPKILLIKHLFDLLLIAISAIIVAPIIIIIAFMVRIILGNPVIFKQSRPGYKGKIFQIYKFRTMNSASYMDGSLLPDAERLTPFGRFLRATSLDELPELLNVLKGEMSLVGPRPLLIQYLERYSPEQARRHNLLPGITGWAQINGRNSLDWKSRLEMDVWYVDHWSLWLDIKIIILTVWKVIKREGISQPGHATVEEFMGNE